MIITLIWLIVGTVLLIKGADLLVDGAVALARNFKLNDYVIGLTVVAFGTSMPELVVNVVSSFKGSSQLAIGNVLGSNIANIFLILGVAALIYPIKVVKSITKREIPLSLFAAFALLGLTSDRFLGVANLNTLTGADGLILLGCFSIFIYTSLRSGQLDEAAYTVGPKKISLPAAMALTFLGLVGLTLGGHLLVDSAVKIARAMHVSELLIGLSVVAIGTSLPELATSVVAATKRNSDIAIGNIIGSNIFNTFFILGVSASIRPLLFLKETIFDSWVNIIASAVLLVCVISNRKHVLSKKAGVLFLVLYFLYIGVSVFRG